MNIHCFSQAHIELGFIGSSDTEGTALEIADEGRSTEEVQNSSLAMWEAEVQHIELEKGSMGLGFSILDYQVISALLSLSRGQNTIHCLGLWIVSIVMEIKQYSKVKGMSLLVGISLTTLLVPLTVLRLQVLMIVVILVQEIR